MLNNYPEINPLITVVSITKNNREGLTRTIMSLKSQTYTNWECLVVLAGLEDESLEIAHQFSKEDKRIKIIIQSSNSKGIFPAMNQGTSACHEESSYINYMNSGDTFNLENSLERMVRAHQVGEFGLIIGGYKIREKNQQFHQIAGLLSERMFAFTRRGGCHQSVLFKTDIVKRLGGYDTTYRLASDYDLILKVIREFRALKIFEVVAEVEGNGISDQSLPQLHREKQVIRFNHFAGDPFTQLYGILWNLAAYSKLKIKRIFKNGKLQP